VQTDFIVLSCDLVTDVFIHYLADIHRSRDATLTMLLKELPPGIICFCFTSRPLADLQGGMF